MIANLKRNYALVLLETGTVLVSNNKINIQVKKVEYSPTELAMEMLKTI